MPCEQPLLEEDPQSRVESEKTELQKTAFNRIVTSIRDFVMFLRDLYIPEDHVLIPPEDGWPEITKESWSSFGKSDEVIEVLRHLTYIKRTKTYDPYEFLRDSGFEDFRNPYVVGKAVGGKGREIAFLTEVPDEPVPSHVVGLVSGGGYAEIVLLDCRNGIICGDAKWKGGWDGGTKQSVEEYFEMLKNRFERMELLPRSDHQVSDERNEWDSVFKPLREIYRKHGWPDKYDKNACLKEITEFGKPVNLLRLAGFE